MSLKKVSQEPLVVRRGRKTTALAIQQVGWVAERRKKLFSIKFQRMLFGLIACLIFTFISFSLNSVLPLSTQIDGHFSSIAWADDEDFEYFKNSAVIGIDDKNSTTIWINENVQVLILQNALKYYLKKQRLNEGWFTKMEVFKNVSTICPNQIYSIR